MIMYVMLNKTIEVISYSLNISSVRHHFLQEIQPNNFSILSIYSYNKGILWLQTI